MTTKKDEVSVSSDPQRYAPRWVWAISGSMLVFSITLNNAGFKRVVDAYAKRLEIKILGGSVENVEKFELRIKNLETGVAELRKENEYLKSLAHEPTPDS